MGLLRSMSRPSQIHGIQGSLAPQETLQVKDFLIEYSDLILNINRMAEMSCPERVKRLKLAVGALLAGVLVLLGFLWYMNSTYNQVNIFNFRGAPSISDTTMDSITDTTMDSVSDTTMDSVKDETMDGIR